MTITKACSVEKFWATVDLPFWVDEPSAALTIERPRKQIVTPRIFELSGKLARIAVQRSSKDGPYDFICLCDDGNHLYFDKSWLSDLREFSGFDENGYLLRPEPEDRNTREQIFDIFKAIGEGRRVEYFNYSTGEYDLPSIDGFLVDASFKYPSDLMFYDRYYRVMP